MDIARLEGILRGCLAFGITDPENIPKGVVLVDVHFFNVAIDLAEAESHRTELIKLLSHWPDNAYGQPIPKLEAGPSYIHAGAAVGDQQRALILFAIGESLGFWTVITPAKLGIFGPQADKLAGIGMVMISDYNPARAAT